MDWAMFSTFRSQIRRFYRNRKNWQLHVEEFTGFTFEYKKKAQSNKTTGTRHWKMCAVKWSKVKESTGKSFKIQSHPIKRNHKNCCMDLLHSFFAGSVCAYWCTYRCVWPTMNLSYDRLMKFFHTSMTAMLILFFFRLFKNSNLALSLVVAYGSFPCINPHLHKAITIFPKWAISKLM